MHSRVRSGRVESKAVQSAALQITNFRFTRESFGLAMTVLPGRADRLRNAASDPIPLAAGLHCGKRQQASAVQGQGQGQGRGGSSAPGGHSD
jgi:hypothetical protein